MLLLLRKRSGGVTIAQTHRGCLEDVLMLPLWYPPVPVLPGFCPTVNATCHSLPIMAPLLNCMVLMSTFEKNRVGRSKKKVKKNKKSIADTGFPYKQLMKLIKYRSICLFCCQYNH